MSRKFLKYKDHTISYLQFGEGKILLIALHGYAINAIEFLKLEKHLSEKYTILAIDLPFHGETQIGEEEFQKEDLILVIQKLITLFPDKQETELMGYSYGGRIALKIFPSLDVNRLWLLASDGLEKKLGYNLPIYPVFFRRFLARLLDNPTWFFKLINGLYSLKLFPKYTHRFMTRHLESEQNRKRLFGTWTFLYDFVINRKELKENIKRRGLEVTIIYGKNDRIIKPEGGIDLGRELKNVEVYFVEAGHKILGEKLGEKIKGQLLF